MKKQGKMCQLSEKELERIKRNAKADGVQKALILTASWLMEEPEFNFSEERICNMWDGVARYAQGIDEHYISLQLVCEIIKQHTGMEIKPEVFK